MRCIPFLAIAGVLACNVPSQAHDEQHGDAHADEPRDADDHEGDHDGAGQTITLDPHVVERNRIETSPVLNHLLLGALEVPAEIQVDRTRVAHVTPLVRGRLTDVEVRLGDAVEKDQVLARMQSTDLGSIRAALKQAKARKRVADAALERKRRLAESGVAAKKDLLDAQGEVDKAAADVQAARAELSVYGSSSEGSGAGVAIRSPLSGLILERHATEGEVATSGSSLFVVADLDRVWAIGSVFERDVFRVANGLPAEVSVIAAPGRSWRGIIDYVDASIDPESRTMAIRVELDNPDGVLRPGLFGTIAIGEHEANGREVLAVPEQALQMVEGRTVVFVERETAVFQALTVIPGARAHGLVEIKDGLALGTNVVVEGSFVLKSKLLEAALGDGHAH